jgi:hypothetical protein
MTRVFPVALTIALAVVAGVQSSALPSNTPHYSKSEIKQMARDAHTAQQYQTLAQYFRSQQQADELQAQSEKAEWGRRSQDVTGPAAKYARPVDSSRNRYEYFAYEAQQMGRQAEYFEGLLAKAQR